MTQRVVSVVVPVYNAEAFLAECLASIRGQSYEHLEIVCVDDGSTDDSAQLLDAEARLDERIRVISQPNGGVSAARNTGLDAVTGDYVVFVDSDDVIGPQMIAAMVTAMVDPVGWVIEGAPVAGRHRERSQLSDFLYRGLRTSLLNPPWGKLYRTELIRSADLRFDSRTSLGEDLLFNVEYFSRVTDVVTTTAREYRNRPMAGSLTRSYRPSKYRELTHVHDRLRELTLGRHTDELGALLSYLRIKSLVSCGMSDLGPESPLTRSAARRHIAEIEADHGGVLVRSGDIQMRAVGLSYRWLGLWRTTRLVAAAKTSAAAIRRLRRSLVQRASRPPFSPTTSSSTDGS
ncbi:glycosyltransferase family 2 protein [Propionibacteriaceae bacterium Y2011]